MLITDVETYRINQDINSKIRPLETPNIIIPNAGAYGIGNQHAIAMNGTQGFKRGGTFTGLTDFQKLTVSVWLNFKAPAGTGISILEGTYTPNVNNQACARLFRNSGGTLAIFLYNSSNVAICNALSPTGQFANDTGWHHFLVSLDLADANKKHCIVDNVDNTANTFGTYSVGSTCSASTVVDWAFCTRQGAGSPAVNTSLGGSIANFYFCPGLYLDLSQEKNVRKFITEHGEPADLGPKGRNVQRPLILLEGPKKLFLKNQGTGGNLTPSGAAIVDSEIDPPAL